MEELAKSMQSWNIDNLVLTIDEETGLVSSASISEISESDEQASRANIEIEISGPPFKIKITIRF